MESDLLDNYSQIKKEDIYEYKQIPTMKKVKKMFRKLDFFANPITFRYKGERKFYTNFGALTSLVIILGMIGVTSYQISIMISYSQISFQETTQLMPPTNFLLGGDNGFLFAYRVYKKDTLENFNTTTYFNIETNQYTQTWDTDDDDSKLSSRPIEMQNCSIREFQKIQDITGQAIDRLQLVNFTCPKNKTYKVRGDFINNDFTYVKLGIQRCNSTIAAIQGYKCKSLIEINSMLSKIEVEFIFLNANFDQLDLLDPIKNYMDNRLREGFLSGFIKKQDIFIQNSTATLYNDYLRLSSPVQLQFYQVKQIEKYVNMPESSTNDIMSFSLRAGSVSIVYERKVFSIYDIFAQLGGLKNSMMFIGLLFCGVFEYNLFLSSLIRQLFHFPAKFDDECKDIKQKKKKRRQSIKKALGKKASKTKNSPSNTSSSKQALVVTDNYDSQTTNDYNNQNELQDQLKNDKLSGSKEVKYEINLTIGRKRAADFNLKTLGLLKGFFCCQIFKKKQTLRESPSKRQALFFQKGEDRLNKELDISNVVLNLRKIKYLMKILLDKDQRRLLQLKKTEFIDSDIEEYDPKAFKKSTNRGKLMDQYVGSLRQKKLKRSDVKLLEITGFKKVLEILNKQKSFQRVQQEWTANNDQYDHIQEAFKLSVNGKDNPTPNGDNNAINGNDKGDITSKHSNLISDQKSETEKSQNTIGYKQSPSRQNFQPRASILQIAPYMQDKRTEISNGKTQLQHQYTKSKSPKKIHQNGASQAKIFTINEYSNQTQEEEKLAYQMMEGYSSPDNELSRIQTIEQLKTKASEGMLPPSAQYSINQSISKINKNSRSRSRNKQKDMSQYSFEKFVRSSNTPAAQQLNYTIQSSSNQVLQSQSYNNITTNSTQFHIKDSLLKKTPSRVVNQIKTENGIVNSIDQIEVDNQLQTNEFMEDYEEQKKKKYKAFKTKRYEIRKQI